MTDQNIINAVRRDLPDALVRANETDGGWLIEVIHDECGNMGTPAFRRSIEIILGTIRPNQLVLVWKLFVYPNEDSRYLGHGTLHTLPSSYDAAGIKTTTTSGLDAYLDIPEFDIELLALSNHHGHVIPALESLGSSGTPILPYQPVPYSWLEANGGEYTVNQVNLGNPLNLRRRIEVHLP